MQQAVLGPGSHARVRLWQGSDQRVALIAEGGTRRDMQGRDQLRGMSLYNRGYAATVGLDENP